MLDHWNAGATDMARTLRHPRWTAHQPGAAGVHVFDLAADTATDLPQAQERPRP
jgi:hypothetical protein